MILLVSGASATLRRYADRTDIGRLVQPHDGSGPKTVEGHLWAADNAAFSQWDADKWVRMLDRFHSVKGCLFATAPDVVGNATETLKLYWMWRKMLDNWPRAYVLQDGERGDTVPWDDITAVFIGGTTPFKYEARTRSIVGYAKARGKWVHMGRVNTKERWRYASMIGCDSADGSGFSKWPDSMFSKFETWQDALSRQPRLQLT